MAQNFKVSVVSPTGGLDKDSDLSRIAPTNYPDALNISHYTVDGQTSYAVQNVLGNTKKFNIPATANQNKVYRISGYGSDGYTVRTLEFSYTNGAFRVEPTFTEGLSLTATLNNAQAAITAALAVAPVPQAVTYTNAPDNSYFDLELTTVTGANYTVQELPTDIGILASTNTSPITVITQPSSWGIGQQVTIADHLVNTAANGTWTISFTNGINIIILDGSVGNGAGGATGTATPVVVDMDVNAIQDNVPTNLAGDANIVGSYDLLGDLFIWSTSNTNDEGETLSVSITGASGATPIVITTSAAHGLENGEEVKIFGVEGNTAANGTWIVTNKTADTFALGNSYWTAGVYTSGGTIVHNIGGIGEIGVAVDNPNTNTTTYTTLIKSKQLPFTTKHQIDAVIEKDSVKKSLYWCQEGDVPRVMYYYGDYVSSGALSAITSEGRYSLTTIGEETKLLLSEPTVRLTFTDQLQSGGAVKSGNWRYTVRLLTESLSPSNWLALSNPINVFASSTTGTATAISGDESGVETSKINNFTVSGIPSDIFKYIELAGVNYVGDAIVAYNLKRETISGSEISLSHTGTETSVTELDAGTLIAVDSGFDSAKNIRIIDNRLVLSNLTTAQIVGFSDWAQEFTHSILTSEVNSVLNATTTTYRVGEYADPMSVYSYMGYMHNETYRFGVECRLKSTGNWTPAFHVDDIVINCSATNSASTNPNRRIAGMTNYDLTDNITATDGVVYVKYLQISGIDLDFLIEGVRVRDLISEFRIVRCECNPTILASGMSVLGVAPQVLDSVLAYTYGDYTTLAYGEFPFITDSTSGAALAYSTVTPDRTRLSFYSPDILYGNVDITYASGDKLYSFGNPGITQNSDISAGLTYYSALRQYNGRNGITTTPTNSSNGLYDIGDMQVLATSDVKTVGTLLFSKKLYVYNFGAPTTGKWDIYESPVIYVSGGVNQTPVVNTDYGFYMTQYYRPLVDQYGDTSLSKYIPTGQIYTLTGSESSPVSVSVFGGDVFTQKSFIRHRYQLDPASGLGFGGAIGFYSQNRINVQMTKKYGDNVSSVWKYPNVTSLSFYLALNTTDIGANLYNSGYTIRNGVNSDAAFDENTTYITDMPTRIVYSDLKPQNSLVDNFRTFLPLNFKDLNLSDGEIVHHDVFNGELVTWQPKMIQRQFFNTTSQLETSGASIVIGDGSVLERKGVTATIIGCSNKWSVIKGRSTKGHDVFYWIDTTLKKVARMGLDGTVSLSDLYNMSSFFSNNLTWVRGKDNPADGEGICGVFADRSVKWTVRGKRVADEYNAGTTYAINAIVSYTPGVFSTFEKTGEIYRSKVGGNIGHTPPNYGASSDYWELIPHTNNEYYNEYTIEFDEYSNTFSTFLSYLPKIYLGWENNFYTPAPVSDTGNVYLHNTGDYCSWYMDNNGGQEVDGSITMVFNADPNLVKRYLAMLLTTEITPKRVDIITADTRTYLVDTDFELLINQYSSAIRNDILTSSDGNTTTEDTSQIWGSYVTVKLTFEKAVYQKLVDGVLKFNPVSRTYIK